MKIPNQIKVGPFSYKIELTDVVSEENPDLVGRVNHDIDKSIRIDNSLDTDRAQATLFHELIHCVDSFMLIGLKEKQIEQLGNGLFMVLNDNDLLGN